MTTRSLRGSVSASAERLEAWQADAISGRGALVQDGFVREAREGDALSRYGYGAKGELASIEEPDGTRWEYGYGGDGRLLSVKRNGESDARYRYDASGRLEAVARPWGETLYAYDEAGRLIRTLRGDASAFSYRYADDPGPGGGNEIRKGSRVSAARCDREETRFGYDGQGRVTRLEQAVDGRTLRVDLGFDAQGRLERMRFPDWDLSLDYAWDEKGRPLSLARRGEALARFGYRDGEKMAWSETADGLREETWHGAEDGRPVRKRLTRGGETLLERQLEYGAGFRLEREGSRTYTYDALGRLIAAAEPGDSGKAGPRWGFRYDLMDNLAGEEGPGASAAATFVAAGPQGRLHSLRRGGAERVYRYNQAGEMLQALENGNLLAECAYDHKGRLVLKRGPGGIERYLYGADDGLLAIADGEGRPLRVFLRMPTGLAGVLDFTRNPAGTARFFHCDARGNLAFIGNADGDGQGPVEGPFACDPFGKPMAMPADLPFLYRERPYHADLGLYWIGCRWYDPSLRRFLTPDTYTGAPDDERLVNPFRPAQAQRAARAQIIGEWLKQPRVRNRLAYCCNDPVNRFDPNGHWSFGGVLLSVLGAIWTLPNTLFGLAVEITCLVGEVVRWIVWLCSLGSVSWETPGLDGAASGRLNAFALVFTGGWLGSFESLLGITFGNVFFINRKWKESGAYQGLDEMVKPKAYDGSVSIPKDDVLYEHELRHVNQYSWFGPFFHLGLPLFGVYEWDVIFNGYQDAWLEKNARDFGGF
jgi:RHS repeat-associated protein